MKQLPYVVLIMRLKMLNLHVISHFIDCIVSYQINVVYENTSVCSLSNSIDCCCCFCHYLLNEIFKYHMFHGMNFFYLLIYTRRTMSRRRKQFTNRQIPIGQYQLIVFIRIHSKSDQNFSKCTTSMRSKIDGSWAGNLLILKRLKRVLATQCPSL